MFRSSEVKGEDASLLFAGPPGKVGVLKFQGMCHFEMMMERETESESES